MGDRTVMHLPCDAPGCDRELTTTPDTIYTDGDNAGWFISRTIRQFCPTHAPDARFRWPR